LLPTRLRAPFCGFSLPLKGKSESNLLALSKEEAFKDLRSKALEKLITGLAMALGKSWGMTSEECCDEEDGLSLGECEDMRRGFKVISSF